MLFDLDSLPASTNEDLKNLKEIHSNLDPIYLNVHMRDDWKEVREYLNFWWGKYQNFADNNFIYEFKRSFSSRVWELYLFSLLSTSGFNFIKQNKTRTNPDFKIEIDNRFLFIEAVAPNSGVDHNKVITTSDLLKDLPSGTIVTRTSTRDESNHPKLRRILSAIKSKCRLSFSPEIRDNDHYVIAINGANIEGWSADIDLIMEAVDGIDPSPSFTKNKDGSLSGPFYRRRTFILNSQGTNQIDIAVFDHSETENVSAVIFFGSDIYNSILGNSSNEVIVVHNPNAKEGKKINHDVFSNFTQFYKREGAWYKK